jgi:hypothetical protein
MRQTAAVHQRQVSSLGIVANTRPSANDEQGPYRRGYVGYTSLREFVISNVRFIARLVLWRETYDTP